MVIRQILVHSFKDVISWHDVKNATPMADLARAKMIAPGLNKDSRAIMSSATMMSFGDNENRGDLHGRRTTGGRYNQAELNYLLETDDLPQIEVCDNIPDDVVIVVDPESVVIINIGN